MTGNGSETASNDGTPGSYAQASFLPVQGLVSGGESRSVVGAKVYVLQVNSSGQNNASVSLLTSATGNPPDSIGHYVRTGEFGGFSIAGDYTCTPGKQVYLLARGGNSGADGLNPAIGLMASLGPCPDAGSFSKTAPFVVVNAVTTVAAAYAMADRALDATHVASPAVPDPLRAAPDSADLVSVATGFANLSVPAKPDSKVPRAKIHTLANILSSCINSNAATSLSCTTLFANARGKGESGSVPSDTATAAINIARNPLAHVAALYGLQPRSSRPFEPALEQAPPDFSLSLATDQARPSIALLDEHP